MINKEKSFFYLHGKTPLIVAIRLRRLARIRQGNFPFMYLGCQVLYGRRNAIYFGELIRKISRRCCHGRIDFYISVARKY